MANAGPVESDVLVCGVSAPYLRYGTEQAPAIQGEASNGVKDAQFRIKSFLSLQSNIGIPTQVRSAAITDFIAATQIKGLKLCVRGDLETKLEPKTVYQLTPKTFQITEPVGLDLLSPSDLPDEYEGTFTTNTLSASQPLRFHIVPSDNDEVGQKFLLPELPFVLLATQGGPCQNIDPVSGNPAALSIQITRKERTLLTGSATARCTTDNPGDLWVLTLEMERTVAGRITGKLHVIRPTKNYVLQMQFRASRSPNTIATGP